jgi:hypothetical protein
MGFANAKRLADAETEGRYLYASYRKQPTQTTASNIWFDLSMSPGNPAPNYYIGVPGVFTPLKQSTDGGIRHGGNVNTLGYNKYLRKFSIQTATSTAALTSFKLMDYIGFYGFIDESVLDEQFLDNTTPLPRYADGAGVQMMAVIVAAHGVSLTPFTVKYTNQDGVSGRVTATALMSSQTVNGTILTSGSSTFWPDGGPFLTLQSGDTGVRSVESVTIGGAGDVGLFALVLVKPLATIGLFETTAAAEKDFYLDGASLPEIKDDAYLNLLSLPTGTLSGAPLIGIMETTWG